MKFILIHILAIFFIFQSSFVYASTGINSFESLGYKQGWLIPNDYTTAMNPPNCKLREPSEEEKNLIAKQECEDEECISSIDKFINGWKICSELGMSIRTNPDGKKVSFFAPTEPTPTIEELQSPPAQNAPQPSTETKSIKSKFSINQKTLSILASLFSLLGGLAFGKGLFISKKDAIELGVSKWAGNTDEENLKLPQVKDRLMQRKWGIAGAFLSLLGFILQVISI